LTPASTGDLYDFLYREYHKIQGRWVSPDRAGISAVDPTNPQSWDRYAYTENAPTTHTDPSGLVIAAPAADPEAVASCWDPLINCYADATPGFENGFLYSGAYGLLLGFWESGGDGGGQAPTTNAYPTPQQVLQVSVSYLRSSVCTASPSNRILTSMRNGAVLGAVKGTAIGAVTGAFAGEVVGAVPGAALGGTVGAIMGGAGGVFRGAGIALACGISGAY
jgi:RHS repeat-associated protein